MQNPTYPPEIEAKIENIINSLIPTQFVVGEGEAQTATLDERRVHYGVPGLSVAVIHEGQIHWERGFGYADIEKQKPVFADSLFQAGSISKPVVATAALKFVQDGLLDLDQDVNEVLTNWKVPENQFTVNEKVTLRRLLGHIAGTRTGGFLGYPFPSVVEALEGKEEHAFMLMDIYVNSPSVEVFREPGEGWYYSGGGYVIIQLLLMEVAQKPFPQIMAETVLEPLGMQKSTYEQPLPKERQAEAVCAHQPPKVKGGAAKSCPRRVPGGWHNYPEMSAAGLWTTAADVARLAIEIQDACAGNGKILTQETAEMMVTPAGNRWGEDWGLCLPIEFYRDDRLFCHGGANEGFQNQFYAFSELGCGVVVMGNGHNSWDLERELVLSTVKEYQWPGPQPIVVNFSELPQEDYQRLTGDYIMTNPDVDDPLIFKVVYKRGFLRLKGPYFPSEESRQNTLRYSYLIKLLLSLINGAFLNFQITRPLINLKLKARSSTRFYYSNIFGNLVQVDFVGEGDQIQECAIFLGFGTRIWLTKQNAGSAQT